MAPNNAHEDIIGFKEIKEGVETLDFYPLDGKVFKFLNVFDNGRGVENKYVSFTDA